MTPPLADGIAEEIPSENYQHSNADKNSISNFANLEELIHYEEQNVLDLISVALKIVPSMLGHDGVRKGKDGKVTNIYYIVFDKTLEYMYFLSYIMFRNFYWYTGVLHFSRTFCYPDFCIFRFLKVLQRFHFIISTLYIHTSNF